MSDSKHVILAVDIPDSLWAAMVMAHTSIATRRAIAEAHYRQTRQLDIEVLPDKVLPFYCAAGAASKGGH